jgi:hypothetical protein
MELMPWRSLSDDDVPNVNALDMCMSMIPATRSSTITMRMSNDTDDRRHLITVARVGEVFVSFQVTLGGDGGEERDSVVVAVHDGRQ